MTTDTVKRAARVRPGLNALQTLPTLCHLQDTWGRIELKLESDDTRYWITTEGLPEKSRQAPVNFVLGYVTVERRAACGRWELSGVFSPEAWRLSQALDYCELLQRELRRLTGELEDHFSWQTRNQVEEVERELALANRAVAALTSAVADRGV